MVYKSRRLHKFTYFVPHIFGYNVQIFEKVAYLCPRFSRMRNFFTN